jgi:DNA polymerase III delta prime subunit
MFLLGNRIIREKIEEIILKNKVVGSFLFYGPKGIGKFTFAKYLAENFDPHDRLIIEKKDDEHVILSEINFIKNFLMTKPLKDRKIVVIDQFNKATLEAQNSFLKTLEEPASNTVFILITQNLFSVLKTIQSRVQIFKFSGVPTEECKIWLKKQKYKEEDIEIALYIYPNQPGLAKKVIDSKAIEIIKDFINFKNKNSLKKLLDVKDIEKETFETLILYLIQKLREKIKEKESLKEVYKLKNFLDLYWNINFYNLNLKIQFLKVLVDYYDQ